MTNTCVTTVRVAGASPPVGILFAVRRECVGVHANCAHTWLVHDGDNSHATEAAQHGFTLCPHDTLAMRTHQWVPVDTHSTLALYGGGCGWPKQATEVATHCVALNMVAERTVPTMPPKTRLAAPPTRSFSSGTADDTPHVQALLRTPSDEILRDWCSRRTGQEIQFRSKRRNKLRRTSRTENS